jgi:hypothetical protein
MTQSRRDFLRDGALGSAGLGILGLSATAEAQTPRRQSDGIAALNVELNEPKSLPEYCQNWGGF